MRKDALGINVARADRAATDQSRACASVDVLANKHLGGVDRKLAHLTALRRELSALITSCEGGAISQCRIIEALGPRLD